MASGVRDKIFISYSKDDQKWLDQLLWFLASQAEQTWWDGWMKAGQKWLEEIQRGLDSAKVAVFLVSQNFLATEFILKTELPQLLAKEKEVAVLWSLVSECPWEASPLASYQAVRFPGSKKMRSWITLSEAELDILLRHFAGEIEKQLRSDRIVSEVVPGAVVPWEKVPPQVEKDQARQLLQEIKNLKIVDEIGSLFVLRQRWLAAEFVYDRMIELAAPYDERWMAWGYEKLGLIYRKEEKRKSASKCWKLARILYNRTGKPEKAVEMEGLLQKLSEGQPPAQSVTPSAPPTPP